MPDQVPYDDLNPEEQKLTMVPADDLPDNLKPAPSAPVAVPPAAGEGSPVPASDLPNNIVPASDLPAAPPQPAAPRGRAPSVSAAVGDYLQNHPATDFSLSASPIGPAQLAKAGTVGEAEDISDKQREANALKDQAMGFFNARMQQYFLDPDFLHLSKEDQDHVIDAQISQWEQAGLPAGKLNAANPNAWMGVNGKNGLRQSMENYANDIRIKGLAGAQEPGAVFHHDQLAVQQVPTATQTAALEFTRSIPGLFGGNVGGELGAAGGEATGIPGGGIVGGVLGSVAGAFGGEKAMRGAIDEYGGEKTRNALEGLDVLTDLGEQEHPLAAWIGQMGGQFTHNQLGFQQLLRGEGLPAALAPRLAGGFIGGGVEAASEEGRGADLDPYKIGQAALSGTIFTKPRYLGEGSVPMSFEGRNWIDTNTPLPQHLSAVEGLLRSGKAPKTIFDTMGDTLPNTPQNVAALRTARAELAAGRDPSASINALSFRPNGLSVDNAVSSVNKHLEGVEGAPAVSVHDNYDSDTIPDNMKDKVGPGTLGWKDEDGNIHIIASQHHDDAAVTATLFHENMHVGLKRAYADGLDDKLVNVYDNASPNLQKALAAKYAEQAQTRHDWGQLDDDQKKSLVVDEVLADTAENGQFRNDFDKVASYIRGFGRTQLGKFGKSLNYSDSEIRNIMSTGYDASRVAGGDASGPLRYLNFGVNSKTADLDSLDSYDRYGGVPRKPEYENGWFESPIDQKPRYEVSDNKANLLGDNGLSSGRGVSLDKVLDHPVLYEAYPHLRDVKVKLDNDPEVNGSWSRRDNTIYLNPRASDPVGTLLHEIQHAVQDHEGWARGSNTESVYRTTPAGVVQEVTGNPDEWEGRRQVRNDPALKDKLYERSAGEYEARAAASRRTMDDLDRLDHPQFTRVDDRGVHPADLYEPMNVGTPLSDRSQARYGIEDIEDYANRIKEDERARQLKMIRANLKDRDAWRVQNEQDAEDYYNQWKASQADPNTRFSRKYSGSFPADYDGRQNRTEDILKAHYGNFSINNVRGMMRPLEQYNRLTNQDILDAAQDLKSQGFDANLAVVQGAIPDNSGFVVALRDLVRDKLETASEVAGRYRSSGGMRHERELMRAVTDLGQVMSVFDKTASNLGRMLYALRLRMDATHSDEGLSALLSNVRFANGSLDPRQLDKIANALISKDPTAIRKQIDRFDPKWKQYGQSLFYNFILGSKSVQLGNILGNATNIVKGGIADTLGYGFGLGRQAVHDVGDKLGLDMKPVDRMHLDELQARASGVLAGLMNKQTYNAHRAFNTAIKEFFVPAGSSEHENKFAAQSIDNLPMSLLTEYGTRGLQAADAFFRTVLEHSAMQGLATREARRLNGGNDPTTQQIADVMASPTREMLGKVHGEADRMLFQENPSKQAETFGRFMRSTPVGFLVAPIIKTPSNIGRTAFETFDPTGRITQRNRAALKAGGPEADRVRGGQLLASALWAGALYLMGNDMLTGGGPSQPQARAQWLESHVPYTIGNDSTGRMPLRGISPIGDGLAMIADGRDAIRAGTRGTDSTAADMSLNIASAMSDAYLQNSFLSSTTTQLERGMKPAISNLLGTLVQSAVSIPVYSQYRKEADPFVRDTSNEGSIVPSMADKASLMDDPMAQHYFPGVRPRDELPIRRDVFGAPIMADSPTSTDPIAQEIGRLVDSTGKAVVPMPNRTIKGMHVPDDLYNSFMAISGPVLREAVKQIMDDPVYKKTLNDDQRAALIRSNSTLKGLHARLNKQLEQMMLDRNPKFEGNFIPQDTKTIATIPGEN